MVTGDRCGMLPLELLEAEITRDVIGAFYDVYNILGFGFLEFVYSLALERELLRRGRTVGRDVSVPVTYRRSDSSKVRAIGRIRAISVPGFHSYPEQGSPENLWTRIAPSGESSRMTGDVQHPLR